MKLQQLFIYSDFMKLKTCMSIFMFHFTATDPSEMLSHWAFNCFAFNHLRSFFPVCLFSAIIYILPLSRAVTVTKH